MEKQCREKLQTDQIRSYRVSLLTETAGDACLYFWREVCSKDKRHPRLKGAGMPLNIALADFFYFARANTARACLYPDMGPVRSYGLYALDVRLGYFLRFVVGVAHLVATELALAANFTCSRHSSVLRFSSKIKVKGQKQAYISTRTPGLQGENADSLFKHLTSATG
jgi:hypothetical protein